MINASFASFWHGPELSAYEFACLDSFAKHGSAVVLYSYGGIANLPKGVVARDAAAILPGTELNAFPIKGVPSMAHFTDYFRFVMFRKTGEIWTDTDVLLLRPFRLGTTGNIIGKESASSICTALLRLDPDDHRLATLIERVEAMKGAQIEWGDTGPRLLTAVYGVDAGMPENVFYPVHFDDYYKVLLPRHFDECAALCAGSTALHLWNNRLVSMGLFKRIGPPRGSFLHYLFEKTGANELFSDFYPVGVMQTMINNVEQKVGRDEGLRKLARIALPVIKSAVLRRLNM